MKKRSNISRYNTIAITLVIIDLIVCAAFASLAVDSGSAYVQDPVTFSDDGQLDAVRMIKVPFPGVDEKEYTWEFPYSDGFFRIPSEEFSVTTARGSMGLTVSAFRSTTGSVSLQYKTYLRKAGFTNIHAFGYDSPTSVDSLSGVIGMKRIDDVTVIAAAACGQGYGNEWASNMKVGNGSRHEGFSKAAGLFESQLKQYIKDNGIDGKKKLWLSGFSRASAIANILAADMIGSGEFDDVYAYLFGVPRTTKEPVRYSGIYNICGQYDPVPAVPLQTWGYERYGTDIYTPAQEADADYSKYADSAEAVGAVLDGKGFHNNPEINYQLRLIVECFGELMTDSGIYTERLQDIMEDVIIHHDGEHIISILPEVLAKLKPENAQDKTRIDTLVDYFGYIAGRHLRADQSQIEEGGWDPNATLAENAALEHIPSTYIRWLFSESEPFTSGIVSRRIIVIGKADVAVRKDGKEIARIDKRGRKFFPAADSADSQTRIPEVFMMRNENETVVSLPGNEEYYVTLDTDQHCMVSLYGLAVSPRRLASEADTINLYRLSPGSYGTGIIPGKTISPSLDVIKGECMLLGSSDFEYSAASVMNDELEATRHHYLSLRSAYGLIMNVVIGLVVFLLACLIINIYHRYKVRNGHEPYSKWFVIAPYLTAIAGFTVLTVLVTFHLFAIDLVRIICASFTVFSIFLLSLRGTIRYRRKGSILLTAFLFVMFAITFLFFNRNHAVEFSWVSATLFAAAMAIWSALAVMTFRDPEDATTKANTRGIDEKTR